ncbi:hypothetical protein SAY86_012995 [Trapa natans]|uniref:TATA box binding protein associated factor (TAF) histone-like fold domain-containing protein n=1 Tax=Trapa natans TaxID=22666 RepID=A0AAN7RC45_TRANT|nr:hypothetical protein SAY86_012995 [Trapa natans]
MSFVSKESIEVTAQSIGINNLSPDVSVSLAPDVEYRLREFMQEAIKCMHHCRRTVLTSEDVDTAFKLRNVEPVYGFTSGDSLRFKRAAGHKDLFYIDEKDVEFKDVIDASLPKAPLDTAVTAHWLAVEGVQPAIPDNPPAEALNSTPDGRRYDFREDGDPIDIKMPVKHMISRELQLYFDKIKELTLHRSDNMLFKQVLLSLATDSGIHPLVPHFTHFIFDEVQRNLDKIPVLFALMRMVRSILQNMHIHVEPYLHQLLPSVITCAVTKRMGIKVSDNHWDLRDFSTRLVASICKRFGHAYQNLQPRIMRTLLHTFLDPNKTLPQHYGAIQGLAALGPGVVRFLILPNLEPYLQLLKPEMQNSQPDEIKRREAWRVYGALMSASGLCMYNRMKKSPKLFSPPTRSAWKLKKIALETPNKRKAVTDNLLHQPPLKRQVTQHAMAPLPVNPMQMDRQGMLGGFSTPMVGPGIGMPTMSRQLATEDMPGREGSGRPSRASSILAQAWKEDVNAGHLIASLYEVFSGGNGISNEDNEICNEGILAFIPKPEFLMFI